MDINFTINQIVGTGITIILGIWILDIFCDMLLGFSFVEVIKNFFKKGDK